jgi:hypothetical protein
VLPLLVMSFSTKEVSTITQDCRIASWGYLGKVSDLVVNPSRIVESDYDFIKETSNLLFRVVCYMRCVTWRIAVELTQFRDPTYFVAEISQFARRHCKVSLVIIPENT